MEFTSTLLVVSDLVRSKEFYRAVLGLEVQEDFGENVVLTGGVALQTQSSWRNLVGERQVILRNNAMELYFESDEMDELLRCLEKEKVELVHPLREHRWGQRAIRFYDPDGHMIEVGESMTNVVQRFSDSGMTPEQVAHRMDVSLDYVWHALQQ